MTGPIKLALGAGALASFLGMVLAQTMASRSAIRAPLTPVVRSSSEQGAALPTTPRSTGLAVTLDPDRNGHYRADVEISGRSVRMLVDTGATMVALTREDADALGVRPLPSDFKLSLNTANGAVQAAMVTLTQISIGGISALDVPAVVMPPGVMQESLLGMSFLKKLGGFEVASGRLILRP
jgi:aspartyl protease family protein